MVFSSFVAQAQEACSNYLSWNSSRVYWANDHALYNGKVYKAKWWTKNQLPSNDTNGPWLEVGLCTASDVVNPNTQCNTDAPWSSTAVYNKGDIVIYNDQKFEAKWWTQNQIPSSTDAWQLVAACVYGDITVDKTILSPFSTIVNTPSRAQSFVVSGVNLSSAIMIKAPLHIELSTDGTQFTNELTLTLTNSNVAQTTIIVRYTPYAIGNHTGNITISATGVTSKTIAITATAEGAWTRSASNVLFSNPTFTSIGIGTENVPAAYKLGVDGKIIAKGLKIKFSNWADYVFADDYKLPNLDELEQFVKTNKHLPGIPAEKDVLKNGVAVEDMNVKLLEKVEELTLLMIEQNKKIKALEAKVNGTK